MNLYITEKPSVAREFANALGVSAGRTGDGYWANDDIAITWCVGHLIEMSTPDAYGEEFKEWTLETLPFIPEKYIYNVISNVSAQYKVVAKLLNDKNVTKIYYSGDSAREGEYIQRLVRQKAGHNQSAEEYRVWIDSQTKEEILNGIKNAKPLTYYDSLSDSAYARAKEDYLVGMNFTRALSKKYANIANNAAGRKNGAVSVGRVMSCVLGMIVERERLIRDSKVIPFYGIEADMGNGLTAAWKIDKDSKFNGSPDAYKDAGLLKKEPVEDLIKTLNGIGHLTVKDKKLTTESKGAPLLFNLAELQSECTKAFHISPADTLNVAQSLYEKRLTTYPRTDARVLTTAVCKVYEQNIKGITGAANVGEFAEEVLNNKWHDALRNKKTKYVDDSKVSDHYAIIPTGDISALNTLNSLEKSVYEMICKRFLSIFYPAAEYKKLQITYKGDNETFVQNYSVVVDEGWMKVTGHKQEPDAEKLLEAANAQTGDVDSAFSLKEGKSQPPKRYTTGSMILAMENAGKLIEDEELREQIKGSGIGTSATRAETITKLERIEYIAVDKKTQVIKPAKMGELVYEILKAAMPDILVPEYTAEWEKGLQQIVDKEIQDTEYLAKIEEYIKTTIQDLKDSDYTENIKKAISDLKSVYPDIGKSASGQGETGVDCPICGKPLRNGTKGVYCSGYSKDGNGCNFMIWFEQGGVKYPKSVIDTFMKTTKKKDDGTFESDVTQEVKGFKNKEGKVFNAKLKMVYKDGKSQVQFVFEGPKESDKKCPVCGLPMMERDNLTYCSGYKKDGTGCNFMVWHAVGSTKLPKSAINTFLTTMKKQDDGSYESDQTDLIKGIKNKDKTKTFDARLKLVYKDGKSQVQYVFEAPKKSSHKCPVCGLPMYERDTSLSCSGYKKDGSGCSFAIWKTQFGKLLPKSAIETFITTLHEDGEGGYISDFTGVIKGLKGKSGKPFDAKLALKYKDGKSSTEIEFDKE